MPPGFWRVERFYRCPTEHARRQRRDETRKKNEEPLLHLCLSKAFVLPRDPGEFPPARARYKKKRERNAAGPRGCVIIISIITTTATTTTIRTRARLNNNNLYERYQSPCGRDGFFFSATSRKRRRRRRRRRSALMSERTQKRVGSNASTIQKQHVVIITNDDDDDDNGRTSVYKQNVMRKIFTTRTPTPLIYLFLRDKKCVVCI